MAYPCSTVLVAGGFFMTACGGGANGSSPDPPSIPCGDSSLWTSTELIPAENEGGASYAFDADGALQVVYRWYIPNGTGEEAEFGEQRVMWVHRSGEEWIGERLSPDGHDNTLDFALAAAGDRLHVIWREDYNNSSVYYRELDGNTWSPMVDLTGAIEDVPLAGLNLVGQGDKLALVYDTSEYSSIISDTLRVRLAWIAGGTLASDPVTILEGDLGCLAGPSKFDGSGSLHVVAACPTGDGEGAIYEVTVMDDVIAAEAVGSYRWQAGAIFHPRLSLAAAPGALHVLWTTHDENEQLMLLHAQRANGEWTTDQVAGLGAGGTLVATPAGDVLLVYLDAAAERVKFLVWSDRSGFAPDCERFPDLEAVSAGFSFLPEGGVMLALHGTDVDGQLELSSLELASE